MWYGRDLELKEDLLMIKNTLIIEETAINKILNIWVHFQLCHFVNPTLKLEHFESQGCPLRNIQHYPTRLVHEERYTNLVRSGVFCFTILVIMV